MNVEWSGYKPYVPPVQGPLHESSRRQAREAFEDLMASRGERISELRTLLEANGVALGSDDASVQALNDWFLASIEPSSGDPTRLRGIWYSVVNDIAIFLGELMIMRFPGLRWELFVAGKKDVSYQRHVVVGFSKVPNPKFNVDPERLVATHAHSALRDGRADPGYFVTLMRAAAERA